MSEATIILNEPAFTIRLWEKRLKMSPKRIAGNKRRFCVEEINTLSFFKQLVRKELYTIAGAVKVIKGIEKDRKSIENQVNREEQEILTTNQNNIPITLPENHTFTGRSISGSFHFGHPKK